MVQRRDRVMGMAFLVILGMSCLYVLSGSEDRNKGPGPYDVDWIWNEFDVAKEKAQKENKYILIDFWAVWCTECKEMDSNAFQNPEVREVLKNFVLLKVDVDEVPSLRTQFHVGGMPVIIVVSPEGEEVARITGYQTADQLVRFLRGVSL
ncbi:MAG: thioredoxin family protein [Theionarchaea archaeon]|nr:thioredoxin family protein [Theionarchaea archaeon]